MLWLGTGGSEKSQLDGAQGMKFRWRGQKQADCYRPSGLLGSTCDTVKPCY